MNDNKINPGSIMHQIRSGVRKQEIELKNRDTFQEEHVLLLVDSDLREDLQKLNTKINKLVHRITPNMPVAFMEPRLVSRYKILDRFITPIRRFGNRFFSKWYIDTVSNQQKYLNNDLWFGLNNSIEIITEQNKLIAQLVQNVSALEKYNDQLKMDQNSLNMEQNNLALEFHQFLNSYNQKYTITDFKYSDFAKRFSGDEKDVKRIFSQYIRYFKPNDKIIDIGCGKGFFLKLLKDENLKGVGIDTDPQLIEECRSKGLEAYVYEGSEYLLEQSDSNIDAVFFAHVIEHLSVPQKITFLKLCYRKLKEGGILIIETPNTTSSYVMNNLYYLDPTHEKPLFPEALKHLSEMAGFKVVNSYLSEEIALNDEDTKQYYNYSLILEK
ncbi:MULTISPECIES: bifunctional 2-polyprenyl-6-hydroxyphenol methylase/3-demethylubiquinol 3-O-methyltransferase UbiG [unclassified Paenibacillus]|uniref:class I SAM-dependent methyltransferase n=1 Tax=unclassified Paenibacillus TaxID=185978 RepID=UPI00096D15CC|nr:class I SAM-dependent methyltransferase [Paenibacillus sp. FSL H8-0259]OMF24335.1 hypothetical protein BK132_24750 [Paenibacillus sp. FSL H8-0259]